MSSLTMNKSIMFPMIISVTAMASERLEDEDDVFIKIDTE